MKYWIQRIVTGFALLIAVSMVTFGALNLLGDPLFNILGPVALDPGTPANAAKIDEAKRIYHLDQPLPVRWAIWAKDFATGDMGVQFASDGQPPVTDLIKERIPRSAMLILMAQFFATVISVPWALWAASRRNKPVDRVSTMVTFAMIAIPSFALGVILKYIFALKLGWFPLTFKATDPFGPRVKALVLPALTIAIPAAAVYQRVLRTDVITTLQEDFILMARAKGVSRKAILFRHALRSSLFSFITVFGINTGTMIGGALVAEQIYNIPGLGSALIESIARNDFPVVLAIVMIVACVFVIVNVAVDLLYSVIDPRVRT